MSDVVLRSAYRAFLADPSLEAAEELVRLQERHGAREPVCVEAARVQAHHQIRKLRTVQAALANATHERRRDFLRSHQDYTGYGRGRGWRVAEQWYHDGCSLPWFLGPLGFVARDGAYLAVRARSRQPGVRRLDSLAQRLRALARPTSS